MTKGEIIDTILLKINGGVLSSDSSVRGEDIAALIAPAVNYVRKNEQRYRRREAIYELRSLGYTALSATSPQEFFEIVSITPEKDKDRELYYVTLPYEPQSVSGMLGVREVYTKSGSAQYIGISGPGELLGLEYTEQTFFWYEREQEPRLYFSNIGLPVCELKMKIFADISSASDDAVIPIPSGLELEVIQLLYDWFMGTRMNLSEVVADNKDDME